MFPLTTELRRILEGQLAIAETLKRWDGIIARYVLCYTVGEKKGKPITERALVGLDACRRAGRAPTLHLPFISGG